MEEPSCTNRNIPHKAHRIKWRSKRDCGMLILPTLHSSIGNLIALLLCSQSASYGGAGFGVSGCANVGNTKDILGKSVNHQVTHHIQPNVQSVDVDNLIDALNRLSGGDGEATDTYSDIEKSAQKILSGDDLNPIQAVIIPLSSVSAVADKYKMDPDQQVECMLFVIILCYRRCRLFIERFGVHGVPE